MFAIAFNEHDNIISTDNLVYVGSGRRSIRFTIEEEGQKIVKDGFGWYKLPLKILMQGKEQESGDVQEAGEMQEAGVV